MWFWCMVWMRWCHNRNNRDNAEYNIDTNTINGHVDVLVVIQYMIIIVKMIFTQLLQHYQVLIMICDFNNNHQVIKWMSLVILILVVHKILIMNDEMNCFCCFFDEVLFLLFCFVLFFQFWWECGFFVLVFLFFFILILAWLFICVL